MHTTPATEPDVVATTTIQDKLIRRDLTPSEHVMDGGYPSAENIAASATRDITLVAPVTVVTGRNAQKGTFTPADFTIDWAAGVATCPAGAASRSMKPDKRGLVTFAFSRRHCRPCPIRDQCTLAKPDTPRRITVHPEPIHNARMAAHAAQDSDQWRKTYNSRAGIEGTISEAARGPNIRYARYRGLAKTHLQNVFSGMAINIGRLGTHFDVQPTAQRRPSRVHELCVTHGLVAPELRIRDFASRISYLEPARRYRVSFHPAPTRSLIQVLCYDGQCLFLHQNHRQPAELFGLGARCSFGEALHAEAHGSPQSARSLLRSTQSWITHPTRS